jgi:hypothetical protein
LTVVLLLLLLLLWLLLLLLQAPKPQQPPGEWQFLQCFGERQEGEEVHEGK